MPDPVNKEVQHRKPVLVHLRLRELIRSGVDLFRLNLSHGTQEEHRKNLQLVRQIAAALQLSERTAQNHVQHILTKLGFSSRAQVAAWITDHATANA